MSMVVKSENIQAPSLAVSVNFLFLLIGEMGKIEIKRVNIARSMPNRMIFYVFLQLWKIRFRVSVIQNQLIKLPSMSPNFCSM